jgi:hypothetical protein
MYTQLYFHHVRRIYDFHLQQFLQAWLPNGKFSTEVGEHLAISDAEVISAMRLASQDASRPGHEAARRIIERRHFRMVSDFNAADRGMDPMAANKLAGVLGGRFGDSAVRLDRYLPRSKVARFPVLTRDGKIEWSTKLSATLNQVPTFSVEYVFVDPQFAAAARAEVARFRDQMEISSASRRAVDE